MTRRWMSGLMIGVVAALLAGCNPDSPPPEGGVASLVAQPAPTIADVPLPEGFKLDPGKSWWYSGTPRVVHHQYEGKPDKFATIRFFKEQMVAAKWTLSRDEFNRGTASMEFDKDGERCRVTVSKGTWFLEPTEIVVTLEPAGAAMRSPSPATPK